MKKSLYFRIAISLLFIASACLYGCSDSTPGSTLDEMNFNVNDSLLGPPVKDAALGISFRPPRGWDKVDQHLIDSARARAAEQGGSNVDPNEHVMSVYADSANNTVLAVMRIDSFDVADSSRSVKAYIQKLHTLDSTLRIETALFRKGDYRVHQVRGLSQGAVILRLTFDNLKKPAPVFSFSYLIPRDVYMKQALGIESSVGSLQPLSSIQ